MAHPAEPMDIDNIDSDFDNKENTFHHNNVQPSTEKGYEELDVSELNMKLRYSVTPAASPMSKSYTSYVDNRSLDSEDSLNITVNDNLTRSLNATITNSNSVVKSLKSLPLQSLPTDQPVERNASVLRELDSTTTGENNNITVTVSGVNDIDENLSLPSSSSSAVPTPEATTPTKDIPKSDGGSPIMRGLKSVLNMFRSSQSPIPPQENEDTILKPLTPTPTKRLSSEPRDKPETKPVLASTPISAHRDRDTNSSKRSSPLKESITFNDDLEKELQWKDETTILFSEEKIPIHKLFYQLKHNKVENKVNEVPTTVNENLDHTVEYMDISYNDSVINDRTMTEAGPEMVKNEFHIANESDSEFLDCETESNATKGELYVTENKLLGLNKTELIGVQEPASTSTLCEDNKGIQVNDTNKASFNVTAPATTINKEETTSNQKEDNNLNKIENSLNTPESIQNADEIKTEVSVNIEKSELGSEINLDVTMTMGCDENMGKPADNMLEVSTLESHTKSLSSLLESLDVTKSFDEEKVNNEVNNTFDLTTTLNQDTVNLDAVNLEINPVLVPDDTTNTNATITIKNIENKTFEDNNLSNEFTLDLPENLASSTIQYLNNTINIDKQEECVNVSDVENEEDNTFNSTIESVKEIVTSPIPSMQEILKHNESQAMDIIHGVENVPCVVNTTINMVDEKNNIPDTSISTAQPLQEIASNELTQIIEKAPEVDPMAVNESPADAPLPDDDEMENNANIPTDVHLMLDNTPSLVDRSTIDTEDKILPGNAIKAVTEITASDKHLPDMLLQTTTDLKNDNLIPILVQTGAVLGVEEVDSSKNVDLEVSTILQSQLEIHNVTITNEVTNFNATFDVQVDIINQSDDKSQVLPDVVDQSVNNARNIVLDTEVMDNTDNETINKELNIQQPDCENGLVSHSIEPSNNISDDIPSNLQSDIVSDNRMETSLSACEDILDKNREISEVILTNQKIDKMQHASDVALSYPDIDHATASVCQSTNQNDFSYTTNKSTSLETQDANKTLTMEHNLEGTNIEHNVIPEQKLGYADNTKTNEEVKLNENKMDSNIITEEVERKVNDFDNVWTGKEEVYVKDSNTEGTDKVDVLIVNKTIEIEEDVKMVIDLQKEEVKETKQEVQVKTTEQDVEAKDETLPLNLNDDLPEKSEVVTEDEIVVSGNNSPYVSIAADLDKVLEEKPLESFEEIENTFATRTTTPSSPPITSKGYNFNFDEIDDPFATKVKIRMSPTRESPNKTIEIQTADKSLSKPGVVKKDINKNRRRSQPTRPKLANTKKAFNATFDGSVSVPDTEKSQIIIQNTKQKSIDDAKVDEKPMNSAISVNNISIGMDKNISEANNVDKPNDVNKDSMELEIASTQANKTTSSLEQSTYYSAGTSSSDSSKSRNVFNLPEIDDMNFNPFATKSKMRQSPPRELDMNSVCVTKSAVNNSPNSNVIIQQDNESKVNTTVDIENNCVEKHIEDKMETEPMEKDSSANISNTTSSSKATDKDTTIKEVNTEDEDTVEGPFLEAEDIEDKQSNFDNENVDMMQFNELPAPEHDENADGELFIDAEAFEFLLNQNKSNVVADSGKESLFLKFDPLFAKRMSSDSVVAALRGAQKRQSTPTRTPRQKRNLPVSVAGPSTMNLTFDAEPNTITEPPEDVNTTVSKPMMVVSPAVNPTATLRKSITPTRSNRRSITFTSPAMAVIDRLLSLSANNSYAEQETVLQVSREQNEAELALMQLREVLAEKEIHVYNLRSESKELKDRLSSLESQMKLLETEGQERLKKINDLNEKLSEKTKMNKSMAVVVEEYERTIASLIAETEQDKKRHAEERIALMNERDEQTAHLASMEVSFNDLHSKYEKSKQVIMNYKANEEIYKKSLKEFEENVSKMQKNYEFLKSHATSKLNHANEELQKINRAHEADVLKLNAMIKRKDLHITSLEETLAQKMKANEELTAICDELINKVG